MRKIVRRQVLCLKISTFRLHFFVFSLLFADKDFDGLFDLLISREVDL